jgi:hypothetical protein
MKKNELEKQLHKLDGELSAVVKHMTQSQVIDDRYFGLMRRERELNADIYTLNEGELLPDSSGHFKIWSEWEVRLLRDSYRDNDAKEVAKVLGRTETSIHRKAAAIGITKLFKRTSKVNAA